MCCAGRRACVPYGLFCSKAICKIDFEQKGAVKNETSFFTAPFYPISFTTTVRGQPMFFRNHLVRVWSCWSSTEGVRLAVMVSTALLPGWQARWTGWLRSGVIQAFCQGQEQGPVAQPFHIRFRDQLPVGTVPQVAPVHSMMPGGQDGGVHHIQVVQPEQLPVFDQVPAVPGVIVVVDGDPCIMEQGGGFQQGFPPGCLQFVEGLQPWNS